MEELSLSLVVIENDEPLADSRQVAQELDIEHRSFFRMITEYQEEVEKDFGKMRFEIAPSGKTNQPQKYALLTEDQCYVYLAYSQNTVQARACKRTLVKAFIEARRQVAQLQQPFTQIQAVVEVLADEQKFRQVLLHLQQLKALAAPTSQTSSASFAAEDTQAWIAFLEAWHHVIGNHPVQLGEVEKHLHATPSFAQALPEPLKRLFFAPEPSASFTIRLGKALSKRRDVPLGELTVRKGFDSHAKAALWKVVMTQPQDEE
jgi:phage regulator Rha-like protein